MFNIDPSATSVTSDAAGRPREIRTEGRRVPVTALESIRDETAAYRFETGPRTVFVVSTVDRRYRLVHLLRERRWVVEELAAGHEGFPRAA